MAEPRGADTMASEEDALTRLFSDDNTRVLAGSVYKWLKEIIPYPCGVRLGKDRLSFFIGNYRPAALKKYRGGLGLEMGFIGVVPAGWMVTGSWKTIPESYEGRILVEQWPLGLSSDEIKRFLAFCEMIRKKECNVETIWNKRAGNR